MPRISPATVPSLETVITEVRVRLHRGANPEDILRGFATITLNDCFAVHNLKIIDGGDRGLFVSMPAVNKSGRYQDIAHPINRVFREYMEDVVLDEFQREELRANERR